jgi:hypothetical protein
MTTAWRITMGEVNVTPDDLRDAGESIVGVREGMAESPGLKALREKGMQHYGMDDAGRLSGGFFYASLGADELVYQRNQEMFLARADIEQSLNALASALHIVADVYESSDLENAVAFGFAASNVVPEGLADYRLEEGNRSVWDLTLSGMRDQAERDAEARTDNGETPPGGNQPGNGGATQPTERREPFAIRPDGYGSDPVIGTRYYDANGNLIRTEYVDYHDDGGRTVTTYVNGEKTDEVTYSPGLDDVIDRQVGDSREQMERDLRAAGFDPDNPEDWN